MIRVLLVCIFLAFSVVAIPAESPRAAFSLAAGNWPQQIKAIETAIEGKEYSELSKENRTRLAEQFELVLAPDFDAGAGADVEVAINQILGKAFADSKLVCVYEKPIGSNMKKRVCTTAAAKERARNLVQDSGVQVTN